MKTENPAIEARRAAELAVPPEARSSDWEERWKELEDACEAPVGISGEAVTGVYYEPGDYGRVTSLGPMKFAPVRKPRS